MPKDKRSGRSAPQKSRNHPYKARGKSSEGDSVGDRDARRDDWEDASCPVCLESPHNAVLLICSSHADGCRPYMCNTSDRHSNCLDQYQKAQVDLQKSQSPTQAVSSSEEHPQPLVVNPLNAGDTLNLRIVDAYPAAPPTRRPLRASTTSPEHAVEDVDMEHVLFEAFNSRIARLNSVVATRRSRRNTPHPLLPRHETEAAGMDTIDLETGSEGEGFEGASSMEEHTTLSSSFKRKHLVCPLCRGQIFGWRVIMAARKYFNDRARNCSHESCMFAGTYSELRMHARCEHPFARPCEVDPARQRDWVRMERQREIGDVLSTIGGGSEDMSSDDGHWWSYLFLLHFFGPTAPPVNEESIISRLRDHHQGRSRRAGSARLRQLVESINRAGDGTNNATGGQSLSGEQGTGTTQRLLRRQRSRHGNVS